MKATKKRIYDVNGIKRVVYEENGKFYLKSTNKYNEVCSKRTITFSNGETSVKVSFNN